MEHIGSLSYVDLSFIAHFIKKKKHLCKYYHHSH